MHGHETSSCFSLHPNLKKPNPSYEEEKRCKDRNDKEIRNEVVWLPTSNVNHKDNVIVGNKDLDNSCSNVEGNKQTENGNNLTSFLQNCGLKKIGTCYYHLYS